MPPAPTVDSAHIKEINLRYHDATAASFNAKWLIDFGEEGQRTVREKVTAALGHWPAVPFRDGLEIGAGTGYFALNLSQLGAIERVTATDISDGMLGELGNTASRLGLDVRTRRSDGEELPFPDSSFDLVFGHAILHHLPNTAGAFAEINRVLRPGGTMLFCGEPSRYGSLPARAATRLAFVVSPVWRRALGVPSRFAAGDEPDSPGADEVDDLEAEVDVHSFSPSRLRDAIEAEGFELIRIRGQGFLSSLWGWALRGLYSTADAARVPAWWRRGSLALLGVTRRLDAAVFERVLPAAFLYDLVISARKPGPSSH
jgi:SAM-dependent methyltransferase